MSKPQNLEEHVALAPYTTMKVGGPADYFVTVTTTQEVESACKWALSEGLGVFVLGEGSNIVVADRPIHRLVMKVEILGVRTVSEEAGSKTVAIGAGEHWDDIVARCVAEGLAGIESMSMIPGTAGAAPVQNAGAYGQEIADTLLSLEAYDMKDGRFVTMSRHECGFGYRDSVFKREAAGRYVITSITLKLSKGTPGAATYDSLKRYLAENQIEKPTLLQIREAVMAIRARLLPDPSVVPNSGSFFKSPIVDAQVLAALEKTYGKVPAFKYGDKYKIAAGWIVEQCGFKGAEHFGLRVHPVHALVITNPNHAGYEDLMKLVSAIQNAAREKFGLDLEQEPLLVK